MKISIHAVNLFVTDMHAQFWDSRHVMNSNLNFKLMMVATCSYVYTTSLKSYMEREDLTLHDGVDAYEGK